MLSAMKDLSDHYKDSIEADYSVRSPKGLRRSLTIFGLGVVAGLLINWLF